MAEILRPFQLEALRLLEDPGHVICVAPTGAGKSLIYERRTQAHAERALLVTPLTALARQQRQGLAAAGVPVALGAGPEPESPPGGRSGAWIVSPESLLGAR